MADRVSQTVGEVSASGTPNARASQTTAEVIAGGTPNARASQAVGEVSASGAPLARVSLLVVQLLIRSRDVAMPPVYPDLPGQPAYSFIWSPEFFNASDSNPVGVDTDLALAPSGVHHFELTYQVLRNKWEAGSVEFKTIFGFFGRMGGKAGRFLFKNPHDNTVLRQPIGSTDGINNVFGPIPRTFGIGTNVFTEPVGYIDPVAPFKLYFDDVEQDPSSYTLLQTKPGNQQIRFSSTPGVHVMTADFSFYYYCKFEDDTLMFDEFMRELFELKKIKIKSLRAQT